MSQLYSVLKVSPLPVENQHHLSIIEKENEPSSYGYETVGGILSNTKYIWSSNGANFKVINTKLGIKVAAWSFGSVIKDYSTKVICVDELHRSNWKLPLLIVGLDCEIGGGIICVFDITNSRVLRAIQIEEKLTKLHVIDTNQGSCPLPGPLRAFDGILSVGTRGGNVFLIDLCCQIYEEILGGCNYSEIRDELNSCRIKTIFLDDIYSLELYKQNALRNGEHLCVHINSTFNEDIPHFILKGPKGDDQIHVNKAEVQISALHYCSQLGSLLVGYNFGAWQLWDLINLKLLYTSPIYEENTPVAHFAIQEPCDDPRSFCYVWAVYSNTEMYTVGIPIAVLYSLNYGAKEWHEGYGVLYQDLLSCTVRFQTDLKLFHANENSNILQGSYCLRLQAVTKTISKGSPVQDHHEDTFALCYIIWSEWKSESNNMNICKTYMSLFDLNQWYKEQMPSSSNLQDNENYMSSICLSDLVTENSSEQNMVLDVLININTLNQFIGSEKLEEHYYPTSLAFEFCSLRENDFVFYKKEACQRYLLRQLEFGGPLSIINPTHFYQQCIDVGLVPLFLDGAPDITPSHDYQREILLSIALEQQLLGYLCKCAAAWSNGSYAASGSTLHFLLTWGWQRALVLKKQANELSVPLFDYSGFRLDSNTHSLLSNCGRQLNNLTALFEYTIKKFSMYLLDADEIKKQWQSLQMVSMHLEVLLWLLNVGLLPESPLSNYPREDEFNRISAPYPVDSLIKYYKKRRGDVEEVSQERFSSKESLLFIDNLIEFQCGGEKLKMQWESDGGVGTYPPSSLQALLRTYLVEEVEICYKHCVIVYVFLDLAMILDKSRYKPITTHLIKFPAVFKLSPSIIKITQAFWHLDHEDYSTAMEQLLDPLVCAEDLKMWHHRVAMKALLAQDQHKFALHYFQIRQPPVSHVGDLCVVLSLYVANNMLEDGFSFLRQNKSNAIEELLLTYFYEECSKNSKMKSIIAMPLSNFEEKMFMKYLRDSNHPKSHDLQLLYYIQHGRYVDAYEINEKFHAIKGENKGLSGMSNVSDPELMVKTLVSNLPDVSKRLLKVCHKEKDNLWKTVSRPEPFSVYIHSTKKEANYKSTLIHTIISKAKETWLDSAVETENTEAANKLNFEEVPFVNTPKAQSLLSRLTRTPVIFPKIIKFMKDVESELAPPSAKRFKPLSSELPSNSSFLGITDDSNETTSNLLNTPIIKRRLPSRSDDQSANELFANRTPQSILKNHHLSEALRIPTSTDDKQETPKSSTCITQMGSNFHPSKKTSWGLKPRSSIGHTPRPAVRFDISKEFSDSSVSDNESLPDVIKETALIHCSLNDEEVNTVSKPDSRNISLTDTDDYYTTGLSNRNINESDNENIEDILTMHDTRKTNDVFESSRSRKRPLDTSSETTTSTSSSITTRFTAKTKLFNSSIADTTLEEEISEHRQTRSSSKIASRRPVSRYRNQNMQNTLTVEPATPDLTFPSSLESDSNLEEKSCSNSTRKSSLKGCKSSLSRELDYTASTSIPVSLNEMLSSSRLSFPSMLDDDASNIVDNEDPCSSGVIGLETKDREKDNLVLASSSDDKELNTATPVCSTLNSAAPAEVNSDVDEIKVSTNEKFSEECYVDDAKKPESISATETSYITFPSTLDFEEEREVSYSLNQVENEVLSSKVNEQVSNVLLESQIQESPTELAKLESSKQVVDKDYLTQEWGTSAFSFPSMLEADTGDPEIQTCESVQVSSANNFTDKLGDGADISDTDLPALTSDEKAVTDDAVETNIYADLSNPDFLSPETNLNSDPDDLYLDNAGYVEDSPSSKVADKLNTSFYEPNRDRSINAVSTSKESSDCEIIEIGDSSSNDSNSSTSSGRMNYKIEYPDSVSGSPDSEDAESLESNQGRRLTVTISESNSRESSYSTNSEENKPSKGVTLSVNQDEELSNDSDSESSSNTSTEKRHQEDDHQKTLRLDAIPEEPSETEEIHDNIEETIFRNNQQGVAFTASKSLNLNTAIDNIEETTSESSQHNVDSTTSKSVNLNVAIDNIEETGSESSQHSAVCKSLNLNTGIDSIEETKCESSQHNIDSTSTTCKSVNLNTAIDDIEETQSESNQHAIDSTSSKLLNRNPATDIKETSVTTTNYLDDSQLPSTSYKNDSSLGADLETTVPARRSKRLSSLQTSTPSDFLPVSKRTRRSSSFTADTSTPKLASKDITPIVNKKNLTETSSATPKGLRTRRASSDTRQMPLKKRTLRSSSADPLNQIASPSLLNESKALNIGDYASNRRLTRHQASLLERTLLTNTTTNIDISLIEKCIDDTQTEEQSKILKKPMKRKLRSSSGVSNISAESNTFSEISSVKSKTRSKPTVPTTRKTRSQSVDVSLLQDASNSTVNYRRTRQSSKDEDNKDILEPEKPRKQRASSETLDQSTSRARTKTLAKGKTKHLNKEENTSLAIVKRRTRNTSSSK